VTYQNQTKGEATSRGKEAVPKIRSGTGIITVLARYLQVSLTIINIHVVSQPAKTQVRRGSDNS
jgi:hypothetical protein